MDAPFSFPAYLAERSPKVEALLRRSLGRLDRAPERLKEAMAYSLLAGDALLTEAFALLASGPEEERAALVRLLAEAAGASGMVGGQVLDIAEKRPARLDYLTRLHAMKTGALLRA